MTKWVAPSDLPAGRTDFAQVLAEVEAAQPEHPGMWAEIRRYTKAVTAYDRRHTLVSDGRWDRFEFRVITDPDTKEGVLWARYTGDAPDDDSLD